MTDEEVAELLPVVDEFVEAVKEGHAGFIEACLSHESRAKAFAVILATHLIEAEAEAEQASKQRAEDARESRSSLASVWETNKKLSAEVTDLRERVRDLRSIVFARESKNSLKVKEI